MSNTPFLQLAGKTRSVAIQSRRRICVTQCLATVRLIKWENIHSLREHSSWLSISQPMAISSGEKLLEYICMKNEGDVG